MSTKPASETSVYRPFPGPFAQPARQRVASTGRHDGHRMHAEKQDQTQNQPTHAATPALPAARHRAARGLGWTLTVFRPGGTTSEPDREITALAFGRLSVAGRTHCLRLRHLDLEPQAEGVFVAVTPDRAPRTGQRLHLTRSTRRCSTSSCDMPGTIRLKLGTVSTCSARMTRPSRSRSMNHVWRPAGPRGYSSRTPPSSGLRVWGRPHAGLDLRGCPARPVGGRAVSDTTRQHQHQRQKPCNVPHRSSSQMGHRCLRQTFSEGVQAPATPTELPD